jgi:hypothetical protein
MTNDAGLPSVRESLQLALMAEGEGSPLVDELAEAAADHYHLNYNAELRRCAAPRQGRPISNNIRRPLGSGSPGSGGVGAQEHAG